MTFAHLGMAGAQYALALIYYLGQCVERNPAKAAHWSGKAASKGHTQAQLLLSNLKLAGFGTPKDLPGAFVLVQEAARHSDPGALHSLAWFYEQGVATDVNKERAFALWKEAAEAGYANSQYAIASCLFDGSGVKRDIAAARYWCELAISGSLEDDGAKALLQKIRAELGVSPQLNDSAQRLGPSIPVRTRWVASLKTAVAALQHWLLGLEQQSYHSCQSRNYEQAGNYARAAEHARKLLALTDHPETRARLAHSYSMLRRDADAVREYRKALAQWDHPAIVLGLAQAELRSGNIETASDLLKRVQASHLAHDLRYAIQELEVEMQRSRSSR